MRGTRNSAGSMCEAFKRKAVAPAAAKAAIESNEAGPSVATNWQSLAVTGRNLIPTFVEGGGPGRGRSRRQPSAISIDSRATTTPSHMALASFSISAMRSSSWSGS